MANTEVNLPRGLRMAASETRQSTMFGLRLALPNTAPRGGVRGCGVNHGALAGEGYADGSHER